MSTNFPTSLDDATSIPVEAAATKLSTNHVTAHQNIQDAVEAIEAKVGVDSSAVTSSHDYKLSGVTGTDKAVSKTGTEALTNKTLTAPTITSPKITVGSDAVGDLHYTSNVDGTQSRLGKGNDNQILKMNGTALNWEDETVTVDATNAIAGITELATAAEITAGTATGGDGPLVVTPDQLALSTPSFNGSALTNLPLVIGTKVSTSFETAARFTVTNTGTGSSSFSSTGFSTGGIGGGGSTNLVFPLSSSNGNLYVGSPVSHCSITVGLQENGGTGKAFFGIGNLTVATSGVTLTERHIGFKFVKSGATVTLYATQADGTTETASSALTTVVENDSLDLYFKMNGTSSVDYYWRKNGGTLSSATNLTTNIPTTTTVTLQVCKSTESTSEASHWSVYSMSYERK